jgi:cell division protein FtsW
MTPTQGTLVTPSTPTSTRRATVRPAGAPTGPAPSKKGGSPKAGSAKKKQQSGLAATIAELPTGTVLAVVVALLCVIGLVMVGSASSVVSISLYGSPWSILIRECLWMGVGVVAFLAFVRFDHRRLRKLAPLLLVGTFLLLLVVLVPGLGVHVQGSSRWVGFGQFRLQPSELMKLALAVFSADLITRRLDEGAGDRRIIGPLLLVTACAGLLIVAQPDLGTAMVLAFIALSLLFVSGVRLGPVLKILAGLVGVGIIVAVASPYRRERLLSFLHPAAHGSTSGYQVVQSLIGLGSGHLIGAGLGGGQAQWGFLPNAQTDFIFSVIGEELGFIGAALTLLLLGAFVWFGIRAATRSPGRFGGLLGVGLVAWLASETLINIGAVVGVLPVTGIPLPFISYGGSSLVITMVAAGILVNIARQEGNGRPLGLHGVVHVPRRGSERSSLRPSPARGRGR